MNMSEQEITVSEQSEAAQIVQFERRYFVSVNADDYINGMMIAFGQEEAENYAAMNLAELTQAQFESVGQDCQLISGEVVKGPPMVSEITAQAAQAILTARIRDASEKIQTLTDAAELGMAEDGDAERLTAWKKYRVRLSQLDISAPLSDWPATPTETA